MLAVHGLSDLLPTAFGKKARKGTCSTELTHSGHQKTDDSDQAFADDLSSKSAFADRIRIASNSCRGSGRLLQMKFHRTRFEIVKQSEKYGREEKDKEQAKATPIGVMLVPVQKSKQVPVHGQTI